MLRKIVGLFCSIGTLAAFPVILRADTSTAALPSTPQAWSRAAQDDIRAASLITAQNHPGFVDPANPHFKVLLRQAEQNGLALADRVTDAAGYSAAIRRFSNTLQDGHAGAYPTLGPATLPKVKWPGFVAVWRGDGTYVYNSLPGGPIRGARILSCDGRSIASLARSNVFAFRGRPSETGNWWVEVRRVFMDAGNPFITMPQNCVFQENGRSVRRALIWRETDASFNQWRNDSYNGVTLPVGLTRRDSGMVWIAMPTFEPNTSEQAAYRTIAQQITDERQSISSANAIVLDLRDNEGGSSVWSKMVADALWGNGRRNRLMRAYQGRGGTVKWRTSDGNARHVEALVVKFREQGLTQLAVEWTAIYQGMDAARQRGEPLFTEGQGAPALPASSGQNPAPDLEPLKAPVYVIVPGQCASACLDAVDVFTRFENVKLIGAPSSADSTYMDIRTQALPSGLAGVVIPNKVYIGRARGAGFVYRPAIEVRDLDWSSQAFEAVIQRDLDASSRKSANRTRQ